MNLGARLSPLASSSNFLATPTNTKTTKRYLLSVFFLIVYDINVINYKSAREVIYQSRKTVFHRDIQTPRRESKIRREEEYF